MRVIIIGAGPTGLGAAWQLEQLGIPWLLFEKSEGPGGLSASFARDGYTWDLGGHILFSHYPEFDRILDGASKDSDWIRHERRAYIRIAGAWVPYPFQYNIRHLSTEEQTRCVTGIEEVQRKTGLLPPSNFAEWIVRSMGRGIADLFMLPYNRKVWSCPPERMSVSWVGDRVAIPSLDRVRRNIQTGKDDDQWGPNRFFRFPREGGTGAIWSRLVSGLPADRVRYGDAVVRVDPLKKTVSSSVGAVEHYDALVNTAPLDRFVALAGFDELARTTAELEYTATVVVGVGVRGPLPETAAGKCWMYFPEPQYPFYRVTVFSNYSPMNAPPGCYSLMAEVSVPPRQNVDRDAVTDLCVQGLKRAGLIPPTVTPGHVWYRRAPYGYPIPTLARDSILSSVLPRLELEAIYSRGRFGAWKYEVGNMDHSFMQGVEVAERIANGRPEVTLPTPHLVNSRRCTG